MHHKLVVPVALAAAMFWLAPLGAADKANFSGTWKLNVAKSTFGEFPAPNSRTHVIDHQDPKLKITTNQSSEQGDLKETFDCVIGGDCTIDTGDSPFKLKGKIRWEKEVLVFDLTGDFSGNEFKLLERWRAADDGKTVRVERNISSSMGEINQTLLLEKQ